MPGSSTMHMNGTPPDSPTPEPQPDPLDNTLAEAFGKDAVRPPSLSVLAALEARTHSKLGLHIDSPDPDDAPVRVTEETRTLRDPRGRYQVLGEIGRGGVGVVYKGRDQDLGRDVAMKVLQEEHARNPDVVARFVEEAQIGGQLQHPGIVPVYELGLQSADRPYFAMKLVKGETLSAQLTRRKSNAEDRRRFYGVFEQVCQTMAYAHSRNVVHRDLKPANVMIGAFGEVQVVDWGFAKVLEKGGNADERASMRKDVRHSVIQTVRSMPGSGTQSVIGSMLGTPAYMPPEQAVGDLARIDARSDVFGLGAILCEILTGAPPYREEDGNVLQQAYAGETGPAHERLRQCGADAAMVALCIECLARAQEARPNSAADVAERVSAHLTSVEERAHEAQLAAAEARYRQRQTVLIGVAAVLVLVVGGAAWMWTEATARRQRQATADRVAAAIGDLRVSHGRAQALADDVDLGLWQSAARDAGDLAELVETESIDPEQHRAAMALLAAFREEHAAARASDARRRRDAEMLARLRTARIPRDDDLRSDEAARSEAARLDAAYRAAFESYFGEPLEDIDEERALASMREGDIEIDLAAALDHLCLVRDGLPDRKAARPLTAKVRALAALLDRGDSWRTELRQVIANPSESTESVRDLAERADLETLGAVHIELLAWVLQRAELFDEAVRLLRRGRERYPQDFPLAIALSALLELVPSVDYREIGSILEVAHAILPGQTEVLHRQGMALERLRRFDDSIRLFERLRDQDAGNADRLKRWAHWLGHIGDALREQNRFEEARRTYEQALVADPNRPGLHIGLGNVFDSMGRHDEALACFLRAAESDVDSARAYVRIGDAFERLFRYRDAVAAYERAIDRDPQAADPHAALGWLALGEGRIGDAFASIRRAMERAPRWAWPHAAMGAAYAVQGHVERALVHLHRAVEIAPGEPFPKIRLAILLRDRGELDEALALLESALATTPEDPEVSQVIGGVVMRLGRFPEAREHFRHARDIWAPKLDPHSRGHVVELDRAIARIDAIEHGAAELEAIAAGAKDASDPAQWMHAAEVASLRGEYRASAATYRRGFAVAPDLLMVANHGTDAAEAAVRAASAPGAVDELSEAERAALRRSAYDWLSGQLLRWAPAADTTRDHRRAAERTLFGWQIDSVFAPVRSEEALAGLPAEERARWQRFWRDTTNAVRGWRQL